MIVCVCVRVCVRTYVRTELEVRSAVNNRVERVRKIRSRRTLQTTRRNLVFLAQYVLHALKVILTVDISYVNQDEYALVNFKSETGQEKIN